MWKLNSDWVGEGEYWQNIVYQNQFWSSRELIFFLEKFNWASKRDLKLLKMELRAVIAG